MSSTVELAPIKVPDFGMPGNLPVITRGEYEQRIAALRRKMQRAALDFVVVYGDREHAANLAYLTGYDPRFEEALLVLGQHGRPALIVGNEGLGYAQISPLDPELHLCQTFSLLGQPRHGGLTLQKAFQVCGLAPGARVGTVGWKYFSALEIEAPDRQIELPCFIVDTLCQVIGGASTIINFTSALMHPQDGLRAVSSADQIASFEVSGTLCSQAVRDMVGALRPGLSEWEAADHLRSHGLPLSCHLMLSSGPRTRVGLASPSPRVMQAGDPFFVAFGLQGGLTARAGFLVAHTAELPESASAYVEEVVEPYYAAVIAWWESLALGVPATECYHAVEECLAPAGISLALNPGHLLHLEEWLHSPFAADSPWQLRSGMVLQCDIIPRPLAPHFTSNVEDGLALADEDLRRELAARHPDAWLRIRLRRTFMEEELGIRLRPEVLPLSNWPAVLAPYLLIPDLAMRRATA